MGKKDKKGKKNKKAPKEYWPLHDAAEPEPVKVVEPVKAVESVKPVKAPEPVKPVKAGKIKPIVLMMSGHCNTAHKTSSPEDAHARCAMAQCPHAFHYRDAERYECGCGGEIVETIIPNPDPSDVDEHGNREPVYMHLSPEGFLTRQEC